MPSFRAVFPSYLPLESPRNEKNPLYKSGENRISLVKTGQRASTISAMYGWGVVNQDPLKAFLQKHQGSTKEIDKSKNKFPEGLPWGPVVMNPPSDAGDLV